jgi:hypothetical protein
MGAKSTLGISDSFQGKADVTATSGIAKQISAGRSAGRLESKHTMKSAAYADLYQLMFKLKLAYTDEQRPTAVQRYGGKMEYGLFNRYIFLEKDAAGEWYYDDEYTFSVDPSGSLANNREAMWQENRMNYQQGAFGQPGTPISLVNFWKLMEKYHYPGASELREQVEEQYKAQQAQEQIMQQMQLQQAAAPGQGAQQGPGVPQPKPVQSTANGQVQ